jgi:hypothetical protein
LIVGATFTGGEAAESLHAVASAVIGEVSLERLFHAVPCFSTRRGVWLTLAGGVRLRLVAGLVREMIDCAFRPVVMFTAPTIFELPGEERDRSSWNQRPDRRVSPMALQVPSR